MKNEPRTATDYAKDAASQFVRDEVNRRTGWFRPFCLSVLILILVNTCVVGGAIVLVVQRVVTIPPGLLSALTGNPAPTTIQAVTVLDRIQSLSELLTTRYNYSSLITSQRELPAVLAALYGDKLQMVAVGHVNAGIDVKRVLINQIDPDTMEITLPPPQLLDCFLDEKSSYVVSRDTGFFARPAPNLDQEARRFAVGQFREMALKAEIYNEVQTQASNVIKNFVAGMGVKNVTVKTVPPDPTTPLPASCR